MEEGREGREGEGKEKARERGRGKRSREGGLEGKQYRQDLGDTGSSMNKVIIVLVVSCHVTSGHHNYKWSPRLSIAE